MRLLPSARWGAVCLKPAMIYDFSALDSGIVDMVWPVSVLVVKLL